MKLMPIPTRVPLAVTIAALSATAFLSSNLHAAIFQNGSFEIGSVPGGGLTSIWSLTDTFATDLEGATDGIFAATFNTGGRPPNGTISQTFDTVASVVYSVQFDWSPFSPNSGNTDAHRLQVEVRDGTSPISGAQTIDSGSGTVATTSGATILQNLSTFLIGDSVNGGPPVNAPAPNTQFSTFSFTFTAQSSSSTIVFSDKGLGSFSQSDAILDNVTIVPEPSAFCLVSLVGAAFLARSRRR